MAAVSQRINNYLGGVSKQSDDKKLPGQVKECINGYPDPTFGLTKRPGFKWISNLGTGTTYDSSKWFYINRDDDEEYIGCITPKPNSGNGTIVIWNAITGVACTVHYDALPWAASTAYTVGEKVTNDSGKVYVCDTAGTSAGSGGPTGTSADITDNSARWDYVSGPAAQSYLTGVRTNYDILSVQDTSIITNNLITTAKTADPAFVEKTRATLILTDAASSSPYSLTMNKGTNSAHDVTYSITTTSTDTYNSLLDSLKAGITSFGVVGAVHNIVLTNKGSGYALGSEPVVTITNTSSSPGSNATAVANVTAAGVIDSITITNAGATYTNGATITIGTAWATSTAYLVGDYVTNASKVYVATTAGTSGSTAPTHTNSTASDGAVTWEYKGVQATATASVITSTNQITGLTVTKYAASLEVSRVVSSTRTAFAITTAGGAANNKLAVFQDQVDNISGLPTESFHDHVVKIINTESTYDTYFAKFVADDEVSGVGHWAETVSPAVSTGLDSATMPHELITTATNTFQFRPITWIERLVGDDKTNSHPSFIGQKIQQSFFHKRRLGFLSKDNVSMSQAGDFYNFYHTSAQALTDADPVDLSCATIRPAALHAVIPTTQGLVLFSKSQQFLMQAADGILTPSGTSISTISNYEMDTLVDPVDMGTKINFISKTPSYTRVFGMVTRGQNENPQVLDVGRIVSEWIPATVDTFIASPQNQFLVMSSQASDKIYLYRTYSDGGDTNLVEAWFNWQVYGNVQTVFVNSDTMYLVVKAGDQFTLSKASISQSPEDAIIVNNKGAKVNPCMDLYANPSSISESPVTAFDDSRNTDGGSGYTVAPTVEILPLGTSGKWETGKAYVIGDTVTANSKNYRAVTEHTSTGSTAPSHSSGEATVGGGTWKWVGVQATATATINGSGTVTAYTITNPGSGYRKGARAEIIPTGGKIYRTALTAFSVGDQAQVLGNLYTCTSAGTTADNAGWGSGVNPHGAWGDGNVGETGLTDGSCVWSHAGKKEVPGVITESGSRCYLPYVDTSTLTPIVVIAGSTAAGTFVQSGFTITPQRGTDSVGPYFHIPNEHLFDIVSDTIVGYKYTFDVQLPRTYFRSDPKITDYTAQLNIARMKFAVGLSGLMSFKLKSIGALPGTKSYTGNGSTRRYSWVEDDISYIDRNQIKVKINNVVTTDFIFEDDNTILLGSGSTPASGDNILIYTDEWYNLSPTQKANTYLADDIALDDLSIFTIPVHQKTQNFELRVFNDSPFPVSLNSMMWEGNYSPRFYRRL